MAGISETVHLRVKKTDILPHMVTRLQKYIPKSAKIGIERQTFKWPPKIRMAGISETLHLRLKRPKFGLIMVIAIYTKTHFKFVPSELYYYNSDIYFKILEILLKITAQQF